MQLLLFDVDGTLVDSDDFDGRLYLEAVKDVLGVEIDDDWSQYHNVTDSGILDEVLENGTWRMDRSAAHSKVRRTFTDKVSAYLARHNGSVSEILGAKSFIQRLQAHPEVSIALATGGWRETVILKLRAIGVDTQSLPMASASDATSRIEIMNIAEARALADSAATRKAYFGDGPWDKAASAQLGYDFVAIGAGVEHDPRFRDFGDADAILHRLGLAD